MRLNERDSQTEFKIYLFSIGGELLWTNGEESTNESILLSAFIASLYSFSKDFLVEDLYDLQINELKISLHTIIDKFLIAVIYNKNDVYYSITKEIDNELKNNVKTLIDEYLKTTPAESIFEIDNESFVSFLISVLQELSFRFEKQYKEIMEKTINVIYSFSSLMELFEEKNIGMSVYYHLKGSAKKVFNYTVNKNKKIKSMVEYLIENFNIDIVSSENDLPMFLYYDGVFTMAKKTGSFLVILYTEEEKREQIITSTYEELEQFYSQKIVPIIEKAD